MTARAQTRIAPLLSMVLASAISLAALATVPPAAFEPAETWLVGDQPVALTIGDFNNDRSPDIAVTNRGDDTAMILLNDGAGAFTTGPPAAVGDQPRTPAAADLNGDQLLDLIVPNWGETESTISILYNLGGGMLGPAQTIQVGSRPRTVAAGDLDDDGDIDLVTANYGDNTLTLLRNDGAPNFTRIADLAVGAVPGSVTIGRIDGDGLKDIVATNRNAHTASVFINTGNWTFATRVDVPTCPSPRHETLADFDGDGDLDLGVVCGIGIVSLYRNLTVEGGSDLFQAWKSWGVGGTPHGIVAADINVDGLLDFAVADIGAHRILTFLNDGNGDFVNGPLLSAQSAAIMAAADVDANDRIDLIAPSLNSDWVWVFRNRIPPPPCPADCRPVAPGGNGNGVVNIDDLLAVINAIDNQHGQECDVAPDNGDGTFGNGVVNIDDLLAVIAAFGPCPTAE